MLPNGLVQFGETTWLSLRKMNWRIIPKLRELFEAVLIEILMLIYALDVEEDYLLNSVHLILDLELRHE